MYIIPAPQKLTYNNKEFIIKYNTRIILNSDLGFAEFGYAKLLQSNIKKALSYAPDITKAYAEADNSLCLKLSPDLKSQMYHLQIDDRRITISAGDKAGLLYGVQTLSQIIAQCTAVLPGLVIIDYPALKNRGYYHDVTRGRIPTLKVLKELADKLSYYKLNQLQLYIEHSFLFQDFSEVWRDDTPLTAEEILEFDRYCRNLNIDLVPSIATFGHLHKVLSTKSYEELCELEGSNKDTFSYMGRMEHHTLDITNEKSFAMIRQMLSEFLPLFTSKLFNICADETFDLGKGKSKSLADQVGTNRMYVDFVGKICAFIKEWGRQPMFWGDIIVTQPEAIKQLPEDIICLNWDYSTNASEDTIQKLNEIGATQYLCPGVYGWRRLLNHLKNSYDNISRMSSYAHRYHVAGLLNTDWGDYGHINHPEFSTTGMIYGAAFSWNCTIPEFEEINRQISAVEYLDSSEQFVAAVSKIGSQDNYLWSHVVQFKELTQRNIFAKELEAFFMELKPETLVSSNLRIAEGIDGLYRSLLKMDIGRRRVVKAYLVAAEGMQIFNLIGTLLAGRFLHQSFAGIQDPKDLAVRLEYWFKDYKEIWRGPYKESELYRIQEVIIWYGDYLRELAA